MESSRGGVEDAASPGVLRQDLILQLTVRVCLSRDNAAGARGAPVLMVAISSLGVHVAAALQEECASLGGEIGQHSWGDWPSSGEWGWISFCTTSFLCINTQCLNSRIYPHAGSKKVGFPNISQEEEKQQLPLLQKGLWAGLGSG